MENFTTNHLNAQLESLYRHALRLGGDCEELQAIAERTQDSADKQAFCDKVREFRRAVDDHKQAVEMVNYYQNSTENG